MAWYNFSLSNPLCVYINFIYHVKCGSLRLFLFSPYFPSHFFPSGYGVVTDSWTCYTARIMLVSVIPFAIIQFPRLFHLSFFWERIFVVVTLVVSVIFLLSYFFYQVTYFLYEFDQPTLDVSLSNLEIHIMEQ